MLMSYEETIYTGLVTKRHPEKSHPEKREKTTKCVMLLSLWVILASLELPEAEKPEKKEKQKGFYKEFPETRNRNWKPFT